MSHYAGHRNYDGLFGHSFFQSAIDPAYLASRHAGNVEPDIKEAVRLYGCAIADARAAIEEMRADPEWALFREHTILHMESKIREWESVARSLA
jgi:hypothetical protein